MVCRGSHFLPWMFFILDGLLQLSVVEHIGMHAVLLQEQQRAQQFLSTLAVLLEDYARTCKTVIIERNCIV